jgi:hypothetical protein
MTVKLPKKGHIPVVGGREETYTALYIVGFASDSGGPIAGPVMLGVCGHAHLHRRIETIQENNPHQIKPFSLVWLPDLNVARRLMKVIRLNVSRLKLMGDWFSISPKYAEKLIVEAANQSGIRLMGNREFRRISKSPDEIEIDRMDDFLRSLGFPIT